MAIKISEMTLVALGLNDSFEIVDATDGTTKRIIWGVMPSGSSVIAGGTFLVDTITEKTAANGVNIELFNFKDNSITHSFGDLIIDAGTADVVLDGVEMKMSTFATFRASGLSINNIVRKSGLGVTVEGTLHEPSGNITLGSGTNANEISTTVDGSSTDDQLPTAKAVFDSFPTDLWQRSGTLLFPATPGDTVDLANTTLVTSSGTASRLFGSGNQLKFEPTANAQFQINQDGTSTSASIVLNRTGLTANANMLYARSTVKWQVGLFPDAVTDNYKWFNNGLAEVAMEIENATSKVKLKSGTGVDEISTTVDGSSTDDQLATAKAVFDAVSVEDIWDRAATTITVKNAGDDINFSSAGLIKSGTFDSTNISSYDFHPTFTVDTQIIDKKYVDDQIAAGSGVTHENLTITGDGQTAFVLGATPVDPSSSILTLNGQVRIFGGGADYSITGTALTWNDPGGLTLKTTDDFQIWYDITIAPPGTLDQLQIFYVATAGKDTNDGESVETPFLTIPAAVTAIDAKVPSTTNRFAIYVIDAGTFTVSATTISNFTTLYAPRAQISGTMTLGTETNYFARKHVVAVGGTGITVLGSNLRVISVDDIEDAAGAASTFIFTGTGAQVNLTSKNTLMSGTGSKLFSANTGSSLYLNINKAREDSPSFNDGSAHLLEDIKDKGTLITGNDTVITNTLGSVILTGVNANSVIIKSGGVEAFRMVDVNPKWTNTPYFEVSLSGDVIGATGDGTLVTIPFDTESEDIGGNFDTVNNRFVTTTSAVYEFSCGLFLADIIADNASIEYVIQIDDSGGTPVDTRIMKLNDLGDVGGVFVTGAHQLFSLPAGRRVYLTLRVTRSAGSGDNVRISSSVSTYFSGRLIRKL